MAFIASQSVRQLEQCSILSTTKFTEAVSSAIAAAG